MLRRVIRTAVLLMLGTLALTSGRDRIALRCVGGGCQPHDADEATAAGPPLAPTLAPVRLASPCLPRPDTVLVTVVAEGLSHAAN